MASGWLFPSAWILFVPSPAIREYTGLAGTIISSLLYPVSQHADPGRYTGPTALRCRKYHYLPHFKSICHLWSMWNAANIPLLLLLRFLAFILSDRYFMAKLLVSHHNTVSQNMYTAECRKGITCQWRIFSGKGPHPGKDARAQCLKSSTGCSDLSGHERQYGIWKTCHICSRAFTAIKMRRAYGHHLWQ